MKSCLVMLSLIFLAVSCGDEAPTTADGANPGENQTLNPIRVEDTSALKLKVLEVCAALSQKEFALDDYVARGTPLRATFQESDCDGKFSSERNMDVQVVARNNRHEFVATTGVFGMPEVETLDSGVMKEVCSAINLPGLRNPIETTNNMAIEFRVVETSVCVTDSQHVCVQIMKGPIAADRRTWQVSLNTLISFETVRGDRPGFYAYKNEKTFGSCSGKKFKTKVATF